MPDTNNIMDKICSGCLTYETKYNGKVLCKGYTYKDINYPCQHCLVKAMCEEVCTLFIDSQRKISIP